MHQFFPKIVSVICDTKRSVEPVSEICGLFPDAKAGEDAVENLFIDIVLLDVA